MTIFISLEQRFEGILDLECVSMFRTGTYLGDWRSEVQILSLRPIFFRSLV